MHIRGRQRHVAQRRDFESAIGSLAGNGCPAPIVLSILGDADDAETGVGEIRKRVALEAAGPQRAEEPHPANLGFVQGVEVARRIAIELRIETQQRSLEAGDRAPHVLERHGLLRRAAERAAKANDILGDKEQFLDEAFRILVHFAWRGDRALRLLFEVFGPAVPELPAVIGGIPQRRCATREDGAPLALGPYAAAAEAHARRAPVGKAVVGVVAGGARD